MSSGKHHYSGGYNGLCLDCGRKSFDAIHQNVPLKPLHTICVNCLTTKMKVSELISESDGTWRCDVADCGSRSTAGYLNSTSGTVTAMMAAIGMVKIDGDWRKKAPKVQPAPQQKPRKIITETQRSVVLPDDDDEPE